MANKEISGQLIVRDTHASGGNPAGPGRKLVMVFGILAVPEDFPLEGEHQYATIGIVSDTQAVRLNILPEFGRDLLVGEQNYDGYRPDQLLTAPIWKV
jgi:hypothetical protein